MAVCYFQNMYCSTHFGVRLFAVHYCPMRISTLFYCIGLVAIFTYIIYMLLESIFTCLCGVNIDFWYSLSVISHLDSRNEHPDDGLDTFYKLLCNGIEHECWIENVYIILLIAEWEGGSALEKAQIDCVFIQIYTLYIYNTLLCAWTSHVAVMDSMGL